MLLGKAQQNNRVSATTKHCTIGILHHRPHLLLLLDRLDFAETATLLCGLERWDTTDEQDANRILLILFGRLFTDCAGC